MRDEGNRETLLAVLRVAAKYPHLLDEEPFAELHATLRDSLAGGRLVLLIPDGHLALRVYAMGPGPVTAFGFGGRVPGVEPAWQTLFVEGRATICDDMRTGDEVARSFAGQGSLSYVAIPCRASSAHAEARVVAVLVVTHEAPGIVRRLSMPALQDIGDALAPAFERAASLGRERRLAMILETSSDAMLAWDRDGWITDCNAAAEVLAGRSRVELQRLRVAELLDPPPGAPVSSARAAGERLTLLGRDPATSEVRRIPVAATTSEVDHDARVAAHALLRDLTRVVTSEVQAASDLRRINELEEQHRTLLDNAPVIIFRLDAVTHELVYLNRQAERLLGVPTTEALATPGFLRGAHADADGIAAFDSAVLRAASGEDAISYEARLAKRGGDAISVRGSVYPLLTERGRVAAIEGVLADVSAEQAARAGLVQADRLSTLGTLAAGVAHEINNPAAFMLLGLDLLGRQLEGAGVRLSPGLASSVADTLAELRGSIRRIVDIARDLRLFASAPAGDGGRRAIVDVKSAVESALSLTRGQLLEKARIDTRLVEVPPVLMDEGRLGQVIVNLLVNAAQAIPSSHGGDNRISVATWSEEHDVFVEIVDTGVGVPRENVSRIWEPFFTTKSRDAGTGLGLSISRQIIERAGGTISAESPYPPSSSGGTRFVIRLPAADEATDPSTLPSPPIRAPHKARVLIVEDEAALARALAEEIGIQHEVVVASGAEVALSRLAADRFDVVLCDLRMPGMSGEALYKRVRDRDMEQAERFVFMTGVGFGGDLTRFLSESGREVLEKPFSGNRALDAIARMLRKTERASR